MMLFTLDIDWASEEVIQDSLQLFEQAGIKCTIFATHYSKIIAECNKDNFEIGIHPNFNNVLYGKGGDINQVLDDLLTIVPQAEGARSHSLTQSGPILNAYKERGLVYELNHFLPYYNGIKPFFLWNGLLRIPFNWEDDYHFALNKSFDELDLDIQPGAVNILNFHPVHVFANTETYQRYFQFRHCIDKYEELKKFINITGTPGVRDLLIKTLNYVNKNNIRTLKMREYAELIKNNIEKMTFTRANFKDNITL